MAFNYNATSNNQNEQHQNNHNYSSNNNSQASDHTKHQNSNNNNDNRNYAHMFANAQIPANVFGMIAAPHIHHAPPVMHAPPPPVIPAPAQPIIHAAVLPAPVAMPPMENVRAARPHQHEQPEIIEIEEDEDEDVLDEEEKKNELNTGNEQNQPNPNNNNNNSNVKSEPGQYQFNQNRSQFGDHFNKLEDDGHFQGVLELIDEEMFKDRLKQPGHTFGVIYQCEDDFSKNKLLPFLAVLAMVYTDIKMYCVQTGYVKTFIRNSCLTNFPILIKSVDGDVETILDNIDWVQCPFGDPAELQNILLCRDILPYDQNNNIANNQ